MNNTWKITACVLIAVTIILITALTIIIITEDKSTNKKEPRVPRVPLQERIENHEQKQSTEKVFEWTPFVSITNENRSIYNPTYSATDKYVLCRNDNINDLWDTETFYQHTDVIINDSNTFVDPSWKRTVFKGIDIAEYRENVTSQKHIIEDLRFVYSDRTKYPNSNTLLSGVALTDCSAGQTKNTTVVMKLTNNKELDFVCYIPSPKKRDQEKNWLLCQTSETKYHVFYSFNPLTVYEFNLETKLMSTEPIIEIDTSDMFEQESNRSSMRMSAIGMYPDGRICLILHDKNLSNTLDYNHYCIQLDQTTLHPIRYTKESIINNVPAQFVFVMGVEITEKAYNLLCGVEDIESGVLKYPLDSFEFQEYEPIK